MPERAPVLNLSINKAQGVRLSGNPAWGRIQSPDSCSRAFAVNPVSQMEGSSVNPVSQMDESEGSD